MGLLKGGPMMGDIYYLAMKGNMEDIVYGRDMDMTPLFKHPPSITTNPKKCHTLLEEDDDLQMD